MELEIYWPNTDMEPINEWPEAEDVPTCGVGPRPGTPCVSSYSRLRCISDACRSSRLFSMRSLKFMLALRWSRRSPLGYSTS
jgi:hypothetical protein